MIKGFVFDYGGTLDTGGCHWGKVIWHAFERHGVPVTEQQFRPAYVYAERALGKNPIIQPGYTFRKTLSVKLKIEFEYLFDNGCLSVGEDAVRAMHGAVLDDVYATARRCTAHSREVLLVLKRRFPMVLVSNFYGNISTVLAEMGLDGIFKDVVESAVVGIRKPDPRIFTLGTEALKLHPEEVMAVGDSIEKDILPAAKAGCRTTWLKGEGWTDGPADGSEADFVITDLDRLAGLDGFLR